MFSHEFVNNIRTPVFLVNAAYDFWQVRLETFLLFPFHFTPIHVLLIFTIQIQHVLVPISADKDKSWAKCRLNLKECDAPQMKILHGNISNQKSLLFQSTLLSIMVSCIISVFGLQVSAAL